MDDAAFSLLGIARKAGKLEAGEEPVGAACRGRQAKVVLLACDAAANTVRRAAHFGEAGKVLWLTVPFTKAELGRAVGLASCAVAALTDAGLASALLEKLALSAPGTYEPAARQMSEKAERARERRREQYAREKNHRRGKKKPWVPPPAEK